MLHFKAPPMPHLVVRLQDISDAANDDAWQRLAESVAQALQHDGVLYVDVADTAALALQVHTICGHHLVHHCSRSLRDGLLSCRGII